jgi:hypothetical protein
MGAPVLPLRMAGMQRVLSVVLGSGAADTLQKRAAATLLRRSEPMADYTLEIPLQPNMPEAIRRTIRQQRETLYDILWYGDASLFPARQAAPSAE